MTLSPLGILSGKPTRVGNYTFTISVFVRPLTRNGTSVLDLRDSGNYTLTVNSTPPPTITSSRVLPGAKFDRPYVFVANNGHSLKAKGGYPFLQNSRYPTGYYWQHLPKRGAFQRLPQGMTLNSNGVISGTPVWPKPPVPLTPQTYTIEARATDFLGKFSSANFTLVVEPPEGPEIITECPLPSGLEMERYPVVELRARKGKLSYRWPRPANLPPGLVWNEKGYISGTPTMRGNYTIDLRVVDANGLTANKTCLIVIRPAPELDCPNIPCARVGDTLLPVRLAARGGDLPYRFSATNPPFVSGAPSTLPPGLSINATTGIISGNFTGGGNLTYNATFTVRDNANRTANKTCPIVVRDRLAITTASPLPFGIRGFPYPGKTGAPTVSINATGGWPPYNFQRIAGLLPDGLSINPNTGVISGTPTKTGTFKFTIRVKDSCEPPTGWVDEEFEIPIYDPITVFPQPSPCLTVNRTFSLNLTASGGAPPYVWSNFTASSQNYSLSVPDPNNSRTARVDGTPSQVGPVFFTVNVTSLGITETFTVNYTVHPDLKITSDCPPAEATVGRAYIPQNFQAIGGTPSGNYTWNATVSVNGTIVHRRDWIAQRTDTNPRFTWTPSVPPGGFTGSGDSSGIDHTISIRVADGCGNTDTKNCTVTVYPALSCNQLITLPCLYNGMNLTETVALRATGGKAPYVDWTLTPIGSGKILPNGLLQKKPPAGPGNGSIFYGTITENGTFRFNATVTDSLGNTCTRNHTIVVHPKLNVSVPSPMPSGKVNQAYSVALTASGGNGSYSWRLDPATLPATGFPGISINPSTGVINGTPTQKGFYKVTVILEDSCGQMLRQEIEIPVEDLTYAITPQTEINIWFDASGSMGAVLPVLVKMQSEVLKPCLVQFFNGNGTLFDQRVKVRQFYDERTFSVLNTNGSTPAVTQVINLVFQDEAQSFYHPELSSFDGSRTSYYETDISSLRSSLIGKPNYIRGAVLRVMGYDGFLSFVDAVKGGVGGYNGNFGLADQNDIRVVRNVARPGGGVGTAAPLPGSPMYYGNQIIEVLNSMGFTLRLCDKAQDPPVSLTPKIVSQNPLEGPMVGIPYQGILSAVGGVLPYAWSQIGGVLPNGLTFNSTTGIIEGVPTSVQTANFSVKVEDTNKASDQKGFALSVTWPPLAVDWSEDTPTVPVGQPSGQETFTASGGNGNYTWSVGSGSLPPGIFLSSNSGKTVFLSGTPTAVGTFSFRIRVGSAGLVNEIDVDYIVEAGPAPTPEMVFVEGGTLPPISELDGTVVGNFLIGKYEVTWEEWQELRAWAVANGYTDLSGVGDGTAGNHPVQQVSWYDVLKWSNARSEREGFTPVYSVNGTVYRTGQSVPTVNSSANGYRLPMEAEWEWAARGGVNSGNYAYSGSNEITSVAWYLDNAGGGTNAVGLKAANELAVYDMSGNVVEWVFEITSTAPGSIGRVIRGGSWKSDADFCTTDYRFSFFYPNDRVNDGGFRIARNAPGVLPEN
ncbi:MAG: formylglycine-generating enzyme family protein [Verrucomicrobia bacterium]|nr:formylglycine-generating enzyme family protein [Verrucomicrobiota bacterium]